MFDRFKEDAGRSLSDFTDSDHSNGFYIKIICVCVSVDLLSWIVAFVTPDVVAEWVGLALNLSDKAKAYLLAIPFWSTFFAMYALLRLRRYRNPTATIVDSEVFASYRDTERSGYLRNRILLSLAVAALNVLALVFTVLWYR
ncbi:MAG: hypothetical protein IT174_00050 [Acidobacteria bacterium]|nr:hypothetical protein [Acidobacteriota bacterium]